MNELPIEILEKLPEPVSEIASKLESTIARSSVATHDLNALFRKAVKDKTPMDRQTLIGASLMLQGLDLNMNAQKSDLKTLIKRIAEAAE